MKNMKTRCLSLTLAISMVLAGLVIVPSPVYAEDAQYTADIRTHSDVFTGAEAQYAGKTVILHSNDVHGAIEGYAKIADLEDDFEAAGAEVITVDCGDYSQGAPEVSISKGANAVSLMNLAGYEYATLGNHEFDYGYETLASNLKDAAFKPLCADVLKDNKTIYDPDQIHVTESGVKIGFFGLATPESKTKVNPGLIQGLNFLNNSGGKTELYDCAAAEVKALKDQGADIVVSLAHLGVYEESKVDGHRSVDVYGKVPDIDIILDGHSHTVMTEGPNGEPIQSTGTKFDNIGVVVIDDESKKIESHYLIDTEGLTDDEVVKAAAQSIIDEIDADYGATIATSEVRFASDKSENRCYETNTGDLLTDAMIWTLKDQNYTIDVDEDHIVAVANGGGIRAGLEEGANVTKKDINTILPFGNTVTVAYVKGSTILEALEASTFSTPEAIGGFPQAKGIQFNIDATKPYDKGDLYPGSTYYAPKTIQRVTINSINGKEFKPDDTYAFVTNNFISDGGDTYYAIKAANSSFDTGIPLDEALSDYIVKGLGGKLTKEAYGEPRGDITINAPTAAPVALDKVKGGKKKLTVKFKPEDTTLAVQVAYSTDENFSDDNTKTTEVKAGKKSVVIKKLKGKKTYYVRVRSVVKVGDNSIYSAWSEVKSAKVKK